MHPGGESLELKMFCFCFLCKIFGSHFEKTVLTTAHTDILLGEEWQSPGHAIQLKMISIHISYIYTVTGI